MEIQILNKYKKQITYIVIGLVLLYGIIWLATRKPQIPIDLKASIDSLTVANKKLMKLQEHMDSAITAYKSKVEQIDNHISHIKNQTTVVNKYYNDLGQQVDQYQPTQIDSFFKQRYNY
jgi:prefoldin subunit 5